MVHASDESMTEGSAKKVLADSRKALNELDEVKLLLRAKVGKFAKNSKAEKGKKSMKSMKSMKKVMKKSK